MKYIKIASICLASILVFPSIASAGPLKNRLDRQDKRIYHGAQNGELTYKEYNRLQNRQEAIEDFRQKQIQDGNGLNPIEAIRVNRKLNKQSKQIYKQKHD